MTTIEKPKTLAAVLNLIATLEEVVANKNDKQNKHVTSTYKGAPTIEIQIIKLKRGVDECQQLIELNPKCEERYLAQLGEIAADSFESCKKPIPEKPPAQG